MTDTEIVRLLREYLLKSCGRGEYGLLYLLAGEPNPFDTERTKRVRAWFQSLSREQQGMAIELMDECADMCLFSFAVAMDGAHELADGLVFELHVIDGGTKRLLTSGDKSFRGEYLHDVVVDVLKE